MSTSNTRTVTTELMLTVSQGQRRRVFHRGTVSVATEILNSKEEFDLTGPLVLGEVKTFLFLQSNKNLKLELTDYAGNTVTMTAGLLVEGYFNAGRVVVHPISEGTVITTFFY